MYVGVELGIGLCYGTNEGKIWNRVGI